MARDIELIRQRRALRLRIARLRRRVDGRVHGLADQGRRLTSWRTYVARFPGYAALAAVGLGLTVSVGLRRRGWKRWLGLALTQRASRGFLNALSVELKRLWDEATPREPQLESDGSKP